MLHELKSPDNADLFPRREVIDALRGRISNPIQTISGKPGRDYDNFVTVRLAEDGPGMFGLTDMSDNKEWSGITNHYLLTARYATHIALQLSNLGYAINPQRVLEGLIASHPGRRQSDEAHWYLEGLVGLVGRDEAKRRHDLSNETLGMQLIQGKVPQEAFELVVALGHNVEGFSVDPAIYSSLDFLVSIYIDHRTAQKYEPLNTRMGDFLLGNFFSKDQITPEIKSNVYRNLKLLIEQQKDYCFGKEGSQEISLDQGDAVAENLGASSNSERLSRRELMRLIIQDAKTEAFLIRAGTNVDMSEEIIPMPKWENDFRQEYIQAAAPEILARISELTSTSDQETLDQEFPTTSWWGQYARKLVI